MLSSSKVLTARVGCPLGKKTDDIFSYINLFPPTVVAMEVMSHVARYLKFIVGADLLSKFQCNETAVRVQLSVSFQGLPCRMPVPILKHRLELEGISHVVSLVSFLDVKAENNFTNKIVAHQTTIESPKNSS